MVVQPFEHVACTCVFVFAKVNTRVILTRVVVWRLGGGSRGRGFHGLGEVFSQGLMICVSD